MCLRYNLLSPPEAVRATFGTINEEHFPPRYNIAPAQPVVIVRLDHVRRRELALVRWGLIPSWAKDPARIALFNARAETAEEKASFRGAMRHRRCLVPADGYYDWIGPPGGKRPHLLRPRVGGPIALAGLWEHWLGADGSEFDTMAILTAAANATVATVHDRMPVIVAEADFDRWLDCRGGSAEGIGDLLEPEPADLLEIIQVNPKVSNFRNEGPELWTPAASPDKPLI